ncbi:hypothetical protein [Kitasatospora sp. NPDC007106]|uniref:DUF6907 domain-containing protein n=1 Tax=Kitasatospora sp. NPDC007106 TaxID=3156914 RepID=UPI003403D42D
MKHDPTRLRTAAVRLIDGTTVTVREPAWCLGRHDQGERLADLAHGGSTTSAEVATDLGNVSILDACLTQYPYSENVDDRGVRVAVLLGSAWYQFDENGLFNLADALARHAVELRMLARQLGAIEAKGAGL